LAIGVAFSVSGCFLQPCGEASFVVGKWEVATINNQQIPANGFPLPGSTERLRKGTLDFSETAKECDGNLLAVTQGDVVADYTLLTSAGAPKPSETYAGAYEHRVIDNVVELRANGETVRGVRQGDGSLRFDGTLPNLGGQTVVFRRLP